VILPCKKTRRSGRRHGAGREVLELASTCNRRQDAQTCAPTPHTHPPLLRQGRPLREALLAAARKGNAPVAAALVEDWGADADAPGDDGRRPLELALRGGHDDAFFALLAAGASVARPPGEPPVLHVAAAAGRLRPVVRLVEGGADVHGRDAHRWSALEHAAAAGHEEARRGAAQRCLRASGPAAARPVAAVEAA